MVNKKSVTTFLLDQELIVDCGLELKMVFSSKEFEKLAQFRAHLLPGNRPFQIAADRNRCAYDCQLALRTVRRYEKGYVGLLLSF